MADDPRWKSFTLDIPDFAQLSDEELAIGLGWFDGAWHPQTKAAMKRLSATGLDLNSNWSREPYIWSCPACGRSKPDIFRLTKAGNIKAALELHHDHLEDFYKSEIARQFGKDWVRKLTDDQRHLDHLVSQMIARFQATLICSDCNELDARIKKTAPSIDADFSFSPSEMTRLVEVKPNATHVLRPGVAEEIWEAVRDDFSDRKALARSIIEKVKAGAFRKERRYGPPPKRLDVAWLQREIVPEAAQLFMREALMQLELRSVSHPNLLDKPPKRRRRTVVVPTEADIARIVSDDVGTYKWRMSPDDWICPVCERTKKQVVRKSNAGDWYAAAHKHDECCIRPGYDDGEIRIDQSIDHHHAFNVCGDCFNVMPELRRRTTDRDIYGSFLSADQLRLIVVAAPHQKHLIDWKRASVLAAENSRWNKVIEEYFTDYRHAVSIKESFDKLQTEFGRPYGETLQMLTKTRRSEYPSGWTLLEVSEDLHYTLEAAERWLSFETGSYSI